MIHELKNITGTAIAGEDADMSEQDASCVMRMLDTDNNGTLELDEFVDWVLAGLRRTREERNRTAAISAINARMDNFLTAVSILADEVGSRI